MGQGDPGQPAFKQDNEGNAWSVGQQRIDNLLNPIDNLFNRDIVEDSKTGQHQNAKWPKQAADLGMPQEMHLLQPQTELHVGKQSSHIPTGGQDHVGADLKVPIEEPQEGTGGGRNGPACNVEDNSLQARVPEMSIDEGNRTQVAHVPPVGDAAGLEGTLAANKEQIPLEGKGEGHNTNQMSDAGNQVAQTWRALVLPRQVSLNIEEQVQMMLRGAPEQGCWSVYAFVAFIMLGCTTLLLCLFFFYDMLGNAYCSFAHVFNLQRIKLT